MPVTSGWYHPAQSKAWNKEVDLDSDSIKAMLTTSAHTINAQHAYKSSITNEVAGSGYTAGGLVVAATVSLVLANSWLVARANSTAYALGDVVRPATGNGFLYQALSAGTSSASVPTYPTTIGGTVVDGGVTWLCVARSGTVFDTGDPLWDPSTITARQIHFYDNTPATDATRPLLAWIDLGADVISSNDVWTYAIDLRGVCGTLHV